MTNAPHSTNSGRRRSRTWWSALAVIALLIVAYFVFFSAETAETPTVDGNDNATIETPATTLPPGAGQQPAN